MIFELDYRKRYWDSLNNIYHNEMGVAALMGNLDKESGLIPYRKQGDNTPPYVASQNYTNDVDSLIISENSFVNDSIGYGVAQWTYYTRKQRLYDFHKNSGLGIGEFGLSITMLEWELNNGYTSSRDAIINATSIRIASDFLLHNFFKPKDQSESEEIDRYNRAQKIYDDFHGTEPEPPTPVMKDKMPLWFYLFHR